jgi:hypothetical protein
MADDLERNIAERAYFIWEEQGRLLGGDKEHWAQARRDLGLADDIETPPLQPQQEKPTGESAGQIEKDLLADGKLDTGAVG